MYSVPIRPPSASLFQADRQIPFRILAQIQSLNYTADSHIASRGAPSYIPIILMMLMMMACGEIMQ